MSAGVVEVAKGRQNADAALRKYEDCQSSADRHEGWRYFVEKTDLKAGTNPQEATLLRQSSLEMRESQSQHDPAPLPTHRDRLR